MLNVNEIRLGNWLWHSQYQKAVTVKQIHVQGYSQNFPAKTIIWFNDDWKAGSKFYSELKQFEGIDITPELLEDYGFYDRIIGKQWVLQIEIFNENQLNEQGVRLVWDDEEKKMSIEMHSRDESEEFYEQSHFYETKVTELHQLQNLYQSLTGNELKAAVQNDR